jgi:hypothetical protein
MTDRVLISHEAGSLESKRIARQIQLDERLSSAQRNEMGQFATPPALANDIAKAVSTLWGDGQIRFFEPALGTGAFYSALLGNFAQGKIASAAGVERDHQYASVARRLWSETGLQVTTADFMSLTSPDGDHLPNLILTNPPYVRHHHLTSSEKGQFQKLATQISGGGVSGLSGLYTYFVFAAHRWLAEGGLAAWLIPSEFMDVNYGESLRRYFSREVSLLRIHRFDPSDVQFADALVSSAVVIFRRQAPSYDHKLQVSHGGCVSAPRFCASVPLTHLNTNPKWSRLFNGRSAQVHRSENPLSLLFTIKRGIATGANDFFILSRRELAELDIDERFVKPILPSSRLLPSDVIESDDAGFPLVKEQLAVIDTDLPIEQLRRECVGLWRYLQAGQRKEVQKAYLLTKRSPWYRQEQRAPSPFLCTYMGRKKDDGKTFRFFWNRSAATAANTYLLLYPTGSLKAALTNNPQIAPRVLELLNGLGADGFTDQGRVYGGGLFKMEPRELGRVDATPIVDALSLSVDAQRNLIAV